MRVYENASHVVRPASWSTNIPIALVASRLFIDLSSLSIVCAAIVFSSQLI